MPRLIDADALQENMMNSGLYGCEDMIDAVIEAPTISPDEIRGVGKWSEGDYFDEMYGRSCVCSACGYNALGFTQYCPHCGAKMEVGEDA